MSSQAIKMFSGMDTAQGVDAYGIPGAFSRDMAWQGLVRPGFPGQSLPGHGCPEKSGTGSPAPEAVEKDKTMAAVEVRQQQQKLNRDLKRSMRVDLDKAGKILKDLVRVSLAAPRTRVLARECDSIAGMADELFELPCAVTCLARVAVHDQATQLHLVNVMLYCMGYACRNRHGREAVKAYGLAGLLHDVGKLFIPEHLLTVPRRLTPKEKVRFRRHTDAGVRLLRQGIPDLAVLAAIQDHHERLDGSGYPRGKAGEQVGEMARVLAIADTFDALTSGRAYRRAVTPLAALKKIREEVRANRLDSDVFVNFAGSVVGMALPE